MSPALNKAASADVLNADLESKAAQKRNSSNGVVVVNKYDVIAAVTSTFELQDAASKGSLLAANAAVVWGHRGEMFANPGYQLCIWSEARSSFSSIIEAVNNVLRMDRDKVVTLLVGQCTVSGMLQYVCLAKFITPVVMCNLHLLAVGVHGVC